MRKALVRLEKSFEFSAAHFLPNVLSSHKCARMHGHNYVVTVEIAGFVDPHSGFCAGVDFATLDDSWSVLHDQFDHRTLNERIENPTCENVAVYVYDKLKSDGLPLSSVSVSETPRTKATYHGLPEGE